MSILKFRYLSTSKWAAKEICLVLTANTHQKILSTVNSPDLSKPSLFQLTTPKTIQPEELPISNKLLLNDYRIKQFIKESNCPFQQQILNSNKFEELFETIRNKEKNLTPSQIAYTFLKIAELGEKLDNQQRVINQLMNNDQFLLLCQLTIRQLRFMEPNEILFIIKALLFIKLNPSTLIFTGALHMCKHYINTFEAQQIILLRKFIKEASKTGKELMFLKAIDKALLLALENKIHYKEIDFDDFILVKELFKTCLDFKFSSMCMNQIFFALNNFDEFDVDSAIFFIRLISSLNNIKKLETNLLSQVIKKCHESILNKLNLFHPEQDKLKTEFLDCICSMLTKPIQRKTLALIQNEQIWIEVSKHISLIFDQFSIREQAFLILNLRNEKCYLDKFMTAFVQNVKKNMEIYKEIEDIPSYKLVLLFGENEKLTTFQFQEICKLLLTQKSTTDLNTNIVKLVQLATLMIKMRAFEPIFLFDILNCKLKTIPQNQFKNDYRLAELLINLNSKIRSNPDLPSKIKNNLYLLESFLKI